MLFFALGILTFFALISYSGYDMSWNVSNTKTVNNWIGPAGAYWADFLLQSLGLAAYPIALLFCTLGMITLFGWYISWPKKKWGGIACVTFALSIHAQLFWRNQSWSYPPGGIPGALIAALLLHAFAVLGAWIVAHTLLFIGIALLFHGIFQKTAVMMSWWLHQRLTLALKKAIENPPHTRIASWLHVLLRAAFAVLSPKRTIPAALHAPPMQDGSPLDATEHIEYIESSEPADTVTDMLPDSPVSSPAPNPHIVCERPDLDPQEVEQYTQAITPLSDDAHYEMPTPQLLNYEACVRPPPDTQLLHNNAEKLTKTLADYGIEGHVREIRPGPVVTMYEYVPGPGIKLAKIASLADDLAMSMEALHVRIVAPIPGKGAVGIEIPNETRETVYLREIIAHETFRGAQSPLTLALGKDIEGNAFVADLARMPHLLVAGATGAGKSVSINAMIMSILFKASPADVRMIMVDPKMLELSVYDGIPHLLLPVVTDPKKASQALRWAVAEMERRYEILSELGVRGIDSYNAKVRAAAEQDEPLTLQRNKEDGSPIVCSHMPYILIVVDELADLMMVASREVEACIMRLAQMARASGIHLILATQRPSVDVLTGVIKANFPTRIAFQVASRHDSRTIIDANGAEHLLGRGDMLYLSSGAGGIARVHGAYVADDDIQRTVDFIRNQAEPLYDESILESSEAEDGNDTLLAEEYDEMYDQAVRVVCEGETASVSMIQRRLRIGYNRAARMVERMEVEGILGPGDGAKPREVLISQHLTD